jgi:hypothetical protein
MLTRVIHGRRSSPILCFGGLVAAFAACVEAPTSGPRAQVQPAESPQFFAAAVQVLVVSSDAPVRVDPRPLRPEARLNSISESDILAADSATMRLRTGVLATLRIPLSDATADWRCVFATGVYPGRGGSTPNWATPEPDSVRVSREACAQQGPYTSLAFGLPQAGTDPDHPQLWRIRAMRMMLHGWEIVDLFLEPGSNGTWEVVRQQVRVGAFS